MEEATVIGPAQGRWRRARRVEDWAGEEPSGPGKLWSWRMWPGVLNEQLASG